MTLASVETTVAPAARGFTVQRTFRGLEVRLHSTGFGRFVSAAFLGGWLLFWIAGEAIVLWLLGVGGWSLLTGSPPGPGRAPLELAPSLVVGAFLLFWLALWTIGGIAALHEFFRLLWSDQRLVANPDGLEVTRRTGFITRRKWYPRETVRRVFRTDAALMLEIAEGPVELTQLGTPGQKDHIAAVLSAELALPPAEALPILLPAGWEEISAPEGGVLLVPNRVTRRHQARFAWLVALPLCAGAALMIHSARQSPGVMPLAVLASAFALAATWGACWLMLGRTEWRVEPGRIIQQRRFGTRVRTRFTGTGIHLSESRDSDGDAWYRLETSAPDAERAAGAHRPARRRKVLSRLHDPTEPRRLGQWLALKSGLPLDDAIKPPPAAPDIGVVIRQLEGSGWFGRLVARILGRRRGSR